VALAVKALPLEATLPRCCAEVVSGSRIAVILALAGVVGAAACKSDGGGEPGAGNPGSGGAVNGGAGGAVGSGGAAPGSGGAAGAGTDAPVTVGTGGSAGGAPGTDAAPADVPAGETGGAGPADSVVWMIDNTQSIGGHPTTVSGAPMVIDAPGGGKAVQFNGTNDALFVDYHPLAGLAQFTVEVIFRPDAGGMAEQRFFHMQANGSENRVLFETRLPGNGMWFMDTYVMSNAGGAPLFAQNSQHPIGPWYHAALIVDGKEMRHYVNGVQELAVGLKFQPQLPGQTSFGVRLTKAYWFKGAIRMARFTPRVLTPDEFLKATN